MLTLEEKHYLLNRLPSFELSYEKILHKKVHGEVFSIIPAGKKAFLWFTYWKNQNISMLLPLNAQGQILVNDIEINPLCFSNEIAYGTVIYGTIFMVNYMKHFSFENIFYYKGHNIQSYSFNQKIKLFSTIFNAKEILQCAYTSKFIIVGMPIMSTHYEDIVKMIPTLPYAVYGISIDGSNSILKKEEAKEVKSKEVKAKEAFFKVKATVDADIYNLYCYQAKQVQAQQVQVQAKQVQVQAQQVQAQQVQVQAQQVQVQAQQVQAQQVQAQQVQAQQVQAQQDHMQAKQVQEQVYGLALIPSYKSSVMMNSLFRKIKENNNLDLLEESDDEEEFENIDEYKFVDREKTCIMKCIYNSKFKKWQPISVVTDKVRIVTFKEAQMIEKN